MKWKNRMDFGATVLESNPSSLTDFYDLEQIYLLNL